MAKEEKGLGWVGCQCLSVLGFCQWEWEWHCQWQEHGAWSVEHGWAKWQPSGNLTVSSDPCFHNCSTQLMKALYLFR